MCLAAAVLLVAAGSALGGRISSVSWADKAHRHGWAAFVCGTRYGRWIDCRGSKCPRPSGEPIVCRTDNGRMTWHEIFRDPPKGVNAITPVRTSLRDGIVTVERDHSYYSLWTRDAGHSWHATSLLLHCGDEGCQGKHWRWNGTRIVSTPEGSLAYWLKGWPVRGALSCPPRRATCDAGMTWVPVSR